MTIYCERCEGFIGRAKCRKHLWRVDLADGSSFLSPNRSTVVRYAAKSDA